MDFQMLNRLIKNGMDFAHRRIRSAGLSDTECLICSFINANVGCSQDDVARGLRMDKTTTAKALLSLENKGYVNREQDNLDRRRKVLTVTELGMVRVSEIIHLHDEWLSDVMGCLDEREYAEFEGYCARLIEASDRKLAQDDADWYGKSR